MSKFSINYFFKKLIFLIPRKLRFKIFNLKTLKLYNTKTGKYYLPLFALRDVVRNHIINDQIFDEKIYEISKKFIKEDSIVIDAGANYGQMSILFSKVKKNVHVLSFEAYKYIYDILLKNIKINNANVTPIHCIIGDTSKKGLLIIKSNLKNSNNYGSNKVVLSNNFKNADIVDSIMLDELNINKKISFMKIDVQGYDLKVLRGAKKTILKHKMPIIIEYSKEFETDFNYNFLDFQKCLLEIDYKITKQIDEANYLIESNNLR
jgi:FkbM family methyltransferase